MINIRNLWFSYNGKEYVIKGISLNVRSNEIIGIIGPNGSGKTTLLKLMACLYKPTKGEVLINNTNFWKANKQTRLQLRRKIVYVHEKPIILKRTALDNIAFALTLHGYSKKEACEKSLKMMEKLGIEKLAYKTKGFSAGEKQLISLARALVLEPEILLLDEPTANLDLKMRKNLLDYLKEKFSNKCLIIAAHDLLTLTKIASRYVLIDNGIIVKRGEVKDLLESIEA
ncbi:MAG: energy-coupling factor ABC transporter ATP-binding protein [archaeon GB-1867-035]|nr:energy-coupling factor ABC transporter ATP-binding protein [Candidatus Culexmicrobium profundum]